CSASAAAARRAVCTDTVEWSTTTDPDFSTCASALTFSSTSMLSDTHSTTTSQSAKLSAERAARTLSSAANTSALAWVRLPTAVNKPRSCRWRAIGAPIAPRPIRPTFIWYSGVWGRPPRDWRRPDCGRSGDRAVVEVGVTGQPGFQRGAEVLGFGNGQFRGGDLVAVLRAQVVEPVADIVEHHVGGVAAALLDQLVAIAIGPHFDRVGVTEQVVDVAEDLLVGADQEEAEPVALTRLQRMHRHRGVERLVLDIGVDAAVGVAGQIGEDRKSTRLN